LTIRPTKLELEGDDRLAITWSDGRRLTCGIQQLREACPCASCREKRRGAEPDPLALTVLSVEETTPLKIATIEPVGTYAYSIGFSDGHDTGIFTLEYLLELSEADS